MIELKGIWRSYMIFCYSGKVRHNNSSFYIEIEIDNEGQFYLRHCRNISSYLKWNAGQWSIEKFKERSFLCVKRKRIFEIITIEEKELVLLDLTNDEKIFMVPYQNWSDRIRLISRAIGYIKPPISETL